MSEPTENRRRGIYATAPLASTEASAEQAARQLQGSIQALHRASGGGLAFVPPTNWGGSIKDALHPLSGRQGLEGASPAWLHLARLEQELCGCMFIMNTQLDAASQPNILRQVPLPDPNFNETSHRPLLFVPDCKQSIITGLLPH